MSQATSQYELLLRQFSAKWKLTIKQLYQPTCLDKNTPLYIQEKAFRKLAVKVTIFLALYSFVCIICIPTAGYRPILKCLSAGSALLGSTFTRSANFSALFVLLSALTVVIAHAFKEDLVDFVFGTAIWALVVFSFTVSLKKVLFHLIGCLISFQIFFESELTAYRSFRFPNEDASVYLIPQVTQRFCYNIITLFMILFFALQIFQDLLKRFDKMRKQLEEKNKAQNELNEKLQEQNKKLEQALKSKETFILSLSHEVRNPLNGLCGNIDLAEQAKNFAGCQKYVAKARFCSELLKNFIASVLDTGKMQLGTFSLKPEKTDMSAFFLKISSVCEDLVQSKGLIPKMLYDREIPTFLEIDTNRVSQVILNLVGNAVKFTSNGFVSFEMSWVRTVPKIEPKQSDDDLTRDTFESKENIRKNSIKPMETLSDLEHPDERDLQELPLAHQMSTYSGNNRFLISKKNPLPAKEIAQRPTFLREASPSYRPLVSGYLKLTIHDSGCGIKEEDQQKLFDKFSQVHDDKDTRGLGLGLGLWISKTIIDEMQGKVTIKSKPEQGTCFEVYLKCQEAEQNGSPFAHMRCNSTPIRDLSWRNTESQSIEGPLIAVFVGNSPRIPEMRIFFEDKGYEVLLESAFKKRDVGNGNSLSQFISNKKDRIDFDLILAYFDSNSKDDGEEALALRNFELKARCDGKPLYWIKNSSEAKIPENFRRYLSEDYTGEFAGDFTERQLTSEYSKFYKSIENSLPKVLIVDDDGFNLEILEANLKNFKVKIIRANDGLQALQMIHKHGVSIKLVIMDNEMPNLTGLDATVRISEYLLEKLYPQIPIYIASGDAPDKIVDLKLKYGIHGMMHKPINQEELHKIVRKQLRK